MDAFPSTLGQVVRRSAERYGDRVFLPRRNSQVDEPVTFRQLAADVRRVASGLAARGIVHGDRIGLMSENRYEWLVADLAAASLGVIDVPRGADTAPGEMRFILGHSGCRMVFVENDRLASELAKHRDELPELQWICSMQGQTEIPDTVTLPQLMEEGDAWLRGNGTLDALTDRVAPQDLLTIVYTSGTTAEPKGVMLTHDNVLSNVRTTNMIFRFAEDDRFLSALPPWHMYERMLDYIALTFGAEMIYTDRRKLKEDLAQMQPTLFAAVPRIWETIHDGIINQCQKLPRPKRALMRFVLGICRRVGARNISVRDRVLHPILKVTVLKRFRQLTGGRMRVAVSGGGALPQHVDETLVGLGFPLLNGYGLTETSPVVSVRLPEDNECGTIGPPLPETRVEIRDDRGARVPDGQTGVIWIQGPGIMKGYYRNPERTNAVLVDRWFNSGDLGYLDAKGYIRITGRAKDTIVLASGENVEPEHIEAAIKVSPLIEQAVVVGQDRKGLGALLVVAADTLEQRIPRNRWQIDGAFVTSEEVHKLIRRELDSLLTRDRGFRPSERIAKFKLMHEPMTADNGCMTATLKVKRHVVHGRYTDVIDNMFV